MKRKLWSASIFFCGFLFLLAAPRGWWLYEQGVALGGKRSASNRSPLQAHYTDPSSHFVSHRVTPGEFENQEGLMISWPNAPPSVVVAHPENQPQRPSERQVECQSPRQLDGSDEQVFAALSQVFVEVISATHERLQIVCLVPDEPTRNYVQKLLCSAKIPPESVRMVSVLDADLWARDYGPMTVKTGDGSHLLVEGHSTRGPMSSSSAVPAILSQQFGLKKERFPLRWEGGNLLSNGAGLCLTTTALLELNRFPVAQSEQSAAAILKRHLGANEVVFLKPLAGERTGHVDVFATFTGPDTVVVAQASSETNPKNAKILDENAQRLSRVVTANGPLQVHRVPMPLRSEGPPPFYTNVVYANGVLLVPQYSGVDPQVQVGVLETYQKLLPDWSIVGVDADVLGLHEGSLHCAVNNLYRIRS